jgi:hypothetical protein
MIRDLKEGEFVYIRAEFRYIGDTGAAWVWIRDPKNFSLSCRPVPLSQIVCREPRAMEAEGGIVRGIE